MLMLASAWAVVRLEGSGTPCYFFYPVCQKLPAAAHSYQFWRFHQFTLGEMRPCLCIETELLFSFPSERCQKNFWDFPAKALSLVPKWLF